MNSSRAPSDSELRAHWRVILAAAVGVGAGINGATAYSLGILINPLSDAFGWSRAEVAAAKTFLNLGFVPLAPLIGYIADRFGARRIALLSLAALAVANLAVTQMNGHLAVFYFSMVAIGVAGCATTPLVWTRGVATWFERQRGIALGLTLTGTGLAGVLTPAVIGALIEGFDWRAGYIGLATAAFLSLIPTYLFFFENGRVPRGRDALRIPVLKTGLELGEAVRTVRFWQLGVGFMLVGAVISSLLLHLVPLLTDSGMPRALAVKVSSLLGVAVILGRVTTGYLVDRFHPPYVAGFFLCMPVIGCFFLGSAAGALWLVALAVIAVGLGAGSEIDLAPFLTARYFGLKSYGKIYGWIFIFFYGGVGLGPIFAGQLYDHYGNYDLALEYAMITLGAGALAVMTLGKAPKFAEG